MQFCRSSFASLGDGLPPWPHVAVGNLFCLTDAINIQQPHQQLRSTEALRGQVIVWAPSCCLASAVTVSATTYGRI